MQKHPTEHFFKILILANLLTPPLDTACAEKRVDEFGFARPVPPLGEPTSIGGGAWFNAFILNHDGGRSDPKQVNHGRKRSQGRHRVFATAGSGAGHRIVQKWRCVLACGGIIRDR